MRLSIALCTYNGAKFLDQQLRSFVEQDRLPDELVVSDDGSTDETVTLLKAFAATAPFPVLITRNAVNLGYSENFTQTVLRCTGDVIVFSDQDDLWYRGKLARFEELFDKRPDIQGMFSDEVILNDDSLPVGRTLWKSFLFGLSDQAQFAAGQSLDVLLRRNVVTGMAFAFRRSSSALLRDRPDSWMHDGWLAFLLARDAGLLACPECLVGYRVHGTQEIGTPMPWASKMNWFLRHGPTNYLGQVHATNLDEYQRTVVQFDDLYSYLSKQPGSDPVLLARVAEKVAYARRGAQALTLKRSKRWLVLLPYASSYRRFSPNGLRGLLRDLIL